jgi:hypothetical protein
MRPDTKVRVFDDSGARHGKTAWEPLVVVKVFLVDRLTYQGLLQFRRRLAVR